MARTGECFCGKVTYRINGKLRDARSCHCSRYRKAFSSQASAYAEVAPETFEWLTGENLLTTYESDPTTTPLARYLRTVLRDRPVLLVISRIGIPSRKCHRRITLNNATSITPYFSCSHRLQGRLYVGQNSMQISGSNGSILGANQHLNVSTNPLSIVTRPYT